MKINFKSSFIIGSLTALTLFTSCVNEDEYDFPLNEKPVVTAPQTNFTLQQGETITIPITLSQGVPGVSHLKLELVGGTATTDDLTAGLGEIPGDWASDFPAFEIEVPAYTTEYEFEFTAPEVLTASGDKTVELILSAAGNRRAITQDGGIPISVTITPSENFLVRLDWTETYTDVDGVEHDFCDYDLDIFVFGLGGNPDIFDAATGDCPEVLSLSPGEFPDGEYQILVDYYAAPDAVPVDFESIPASMTFSKPGVNSETINLSGLYTNLDQGGSSQNGGPETTQLVANLTINGSTFTVTNPDTGAVIVSGRR